MTNKTTMPEPVASRFIEKNHYAAGKNWVYCEPFNPQQDWTKKAQDDYYVVQLYSAFQMEAYKDACVRQALEEAVKTCTNSLMMNTDSYCGSTARYCAERIRALIPKEE